MNAKRRVRVTLYDRPTLADEHRIDTQTFDDRQALHDFVGNAAVACGIDPDFDSNDPGDRDGRCPLWIKVEPLDEDLIR